MEVLFALFWLLFYDNLEATVRKAIYFILSASIALIATSKQEIISIQYDIFNLTVTPTDSLDIVHNKRRVGRMECATITIVAPNTCNRVGHYSSLESYCIQGEESAVRCRDAASIRR